MVSISALAIISLPITTARAVVTINCARGINFGRILPQCNGKIVVHATTGSNTTNDGCHSLVGGAIQNAICTAQTTILPTATQDVRVTFSGAPFSNTAGQGQVTLDNYRLRAGAGSVQNTHTFNASLLNPTHSFRVGGRLRFNAAEPVGSYSSTFNITVTSIP